ncbi:uncharacterized protein CLUP02_07678 [Colletotrichum lupini]|uniref:Uncharacterized protein n=1 Tax=Colletotrichum lupini TaxID=145971 RepID=A0A9Q8WGA8_9PEZI|nr:uncharacterized protein CLUP02_07678 [Colletotrichum lupini]UQC82191.1 hypothetical protein CLUP02_07678 [Colletotrichum lupini]
MDTLRNTRCLSLPALEVHSIRTGAGRGWDVKDRCPVVLPSSLGRGKEWKERTVPAQSNDGKCNHHWSRDGDVPDPSFFETALHLGGTSTGISSHPMTRCYRNQMGSRVDTTLPRQTSPYSETILGRILFQLTCITVPIQSLCIMLMAAHTWRDSVLEPAA